MARFGWDEPMARDHRGFRKERRKLAKRERAQNVKIRALKSTAYKRENAGMN